MDSRRIMLAFAVTLLGLSEAGAQNRVRTETIIPPANAPAPSTPAPPAAATPAPAAPAPPLQRGPGGIAPPPPPAPEVAAPNPLPPVLLPPLSSAAKPFGRVGL